MNAGELETAFSLRNRLEEFRQFQEFGLVYQHGIRRQPPPGRLYVANAHGGYIPRRATTFIYAYFVFNALYIIDWESSLKEPDREPSEWNGGVREQEKFWRLAKFCFSGNEFVVHAFTSKLVEYCRTLGVEDPIGELTKITERRNEYLTTKLNNQYQARKGKGDEITLRSIADFRESFGVLYKNGLLAQGTPVENGLIHINNVLYFIYLVRCSVFHGRKQLTIPEIHEDQDVRLAIYAAALMAINEAVIERADLGIRTALSRINVPRNT